MEYKELSVEEMNFIVESFQKAFPDRKNLLIMRESRPKMIYTDIGVLFGDTGSIIIFTIGMSCTVMGENKRCEVFVELPEEAFIERPSYDYEKSIAGILDPKYGFIFSDLITMSKMPAQDHKIYQDLDTVSMDLIDPLSVDTRIYGLRKIFSMDNIDAFYMLQLSMHDTLELYRIDRSDKEKYLSYKEKEKYFSDRVKPISYNFWED